LSSDVPPRLALPLLDADHLEAPAGDPYGVGERIGGGKQRLDEIGPDHRDLLAAPVLVLTEEPPSLDGQVPQFGQFPGRTGDRHVLDLAAATHDVGPRLRVGRVLDDALCMPFEELHLGPANGRIALQLLLQEPARDPPRRSHLRDQKGVRTEGAGGRLPRVDSDALEGGDDEHDGGDRHGNRERPEPGPQRVAAQSRGALPERFEYHRHIWILTPLPRASGALLESVSAPAT
jgi:hypothetical protein